MLTTCTMTHSTTTRPWIMEDFNLRMCWNCGDELETFASYCCPACADAYECSQAGDNDDFDESEYSDTEDSDYEEVVEVWDAEAVHDGEIEYTERWYISTLGTCESETECESDGAPGVPVAPSVPVAPT